MIHLLVYLFYLHFAFHIFHREYVAREVEQKNRARICQLEGESKEKEAAPFLSLKDIL